jgi:peroxiredoxin (alkyl hydroperoxide reductase subunit C)
VIDPTQIPSDLPVPVDDGAAAHLVGTVVPRVTLTATDGTEVTLADVPGVAVVFAYPRTGRPGEPSLVADWDSIPGARGCTPQTCGFRDLNAEFAALGARVFGLSTQETAYQREMTERLDVPFPVLSDAQLALAQALRLPTFTVAEQTLLRRLAWIQRDGTIVRVFYPVFPPDKNADDVLAALRALV